MPTPLSSPAAELATGPFVTRAVPIEFVLEAEKFLAFNLLTLKVRIKISRVLLSIISVSLYKCRTINLERFKVTPAIPVGYISDFTFLKAITISEY